MRIVFFMFFVSHFALGQYIGGQEIDSSKLSPWIPKFEIEYSGNYHFGESESESDFILFFSKDCIIGQVKMGYWAENAPQWKYKYITLTNITIGKNGKLTSDQHSGWFMKYKSDSGKYVKGLKIENPWTGWIEDSEFEFGVKSPLKFEHIYYGKYTKASIRKLTLQELKDMSPQDLKLMRNEIFARYGFTFKKGGAMEKYFKKQDWYRSEHINVTKFLTEIELYNVDLIQKLEIK
ncbi:YARHG domain-containing protein [Tenacibaculum sp. 190524A05c]|uniref:YARHG domain-containing protein n=1 Tax=Tenacibaculum platacis TaxID=3137852 RepID=UPI0032B1B15D